MDRRKIGAIGEDVSCEYLEKNGFKIIERNFLTRHGEIDIIAENDRYIVFIEVKLRTVGENTAKYGRPALAVTKNKMKNIIYSAGIYISKNKIEKSVRFDVIEVYAEKTDKGTVKYRLKHLPSAFTLNDAR